jgi:hypothetical protein
MRNVLCLRLERWMNLDKPNEGGLGTFQEKIATCSHWWGGIEQPADCHPLAMGMVHALLLSMVADDFSTAIC